jgi:hypothetical protein
MPFGRLCFAAFALFAAFLSYPSIGISSPIPQTRPNEECVAPPPATYLQKFAGLPEQVILRASSRVGTLRGKGVVTISALRLWDDATTKQGANGLSISVRDAETGGHENTSFVDYDEIDSLLKAIDSVSGVDRNVSSMNSFEAGYRTRGNLVVATFSTGSGIYLAISSGYCSPVTARLEAAELNDLKTFLKNAKSTLDAEEKNSHH